MVEILKAGIRFLGLAPKTLADIYTDIATIAGAVGASAPGLEVIAKMQREIATVHGAVKREESSSRLLRRVGQAADCFAAVGGRTSGRCGRRVSG